jgi:hypothetical protein
MGEKRNRGEEAADSPPSDISTSAPNRVESAETHLAYQAAVQMAVYDGQLSWQVTGIYVQFAILMIVGSVFPSFVASEGGLALALAALGISMAGIVLSFMFGSMVRRMRAYEEYWVACATELEGYLQLPISTLKGSAVLSRDRRISIGTTTVVMPRASAVHSNAMLRALFGAFLMVFVGLLAFNCWRLSTAI